MTNREVVQSLRALANFYEAHPDLILPHEPQLSICPEGRSGMAATAKIFGSCEKNVDEAFYRLIKKFGVIELRAIEYRSAVCERIVIGVKEIPETILPAREETIVPAHVEEIYEWHCPESLLASDSAQ